MLTPDTILQPGTLLPDGAGDPGVYRVLEYITSGGMASIYLVDVKGRKDGPFILKINGKPHRVPEFYREAWWQHHYKCGIVPCYWSDHTSINNEPVACYVMPYLREGSLLHKLATRTYSLPEAVSWIHALSETLDSMNCVHRDLKPENVLLFARAPLLADFGLAVPSKPDERKEWGDRLTCAGTPNYMSPEQHLQHMVQNNEIDCRSDIFTLALMLYEFWFGNLPFSNDITERELIAWKLMKPKDKKLTSTKLPTADELFTTALTVKRAERYQTHADFRRALLRVHAELTRGQKII